MSHRSVHIDPKERFGNRVGYYVRYRPRYPSAIIDLMRAEIGLTSDSVIADIGSGTGFLSELFLDNDNEVYAVEPNPSMRHAAETALDHRDNFHSIVGMAEATTLEEHSVDFVAAGQAFHWFDAVDARIEFHRVLKTGGYCVFTWNWRQADRSPLVREYEAFCRRISPEYVHLKDIRVIESDMRALFNGNGYHLHRFPLVQDFDFEGFKGRLLSSSYAPLPGDSRYDSMVRELRALFDKYQVAGRVHIDYNTLVYYGRPR